MEPRIPIHCTTKLCIHGQMLLNKRHMEVMGSNPKGYLAFFFFPFFFLISSVLMDGFFCLVMREWLPSSAAWDEAASIHPERIKKVFFQTFIPSVEFESKQTKLLARARFRRVLLSGAISKARSGRLESIFGPSPFMKVSRLPSLDFCQIKLLVREKLFG